MTEQPPLTMDETAIAMHELYESLQRAGFTKREAFQIVLHVMKGMTA